MPPASLGGGQMQRSPIEEEEEGGMRMLWDEASLGDPPCGTFPADEGQNEENLLLHDSPEHPFPLCSRPLLLFSP